MSRGLSIHEHICKPNHFITGQLHTLVHAAMSVAPLFSSGLTRGGCGIEGLWVLMGTVSVQLEGVVHAVGRSGERMGRKVGE